MMLINNFTNANQTKKTLKINNPNNFYDEIINEQPDEENFQQDSCSSNNVEHYQRKNKSKSTIKHSFKVIQDYEQMFSSLTESEKDLEIEKIYERSKMNSLLFDIHEIIELEKEKINAFIERKPERRKELEIYNGKLESLTHILKQSMGANDQVKAYLSKKVLFVLKSIGRFKELELYKSLVEKINKTVGIKELSGNFNENNKITNNKNENIEEEHNQHIENNTSYMIKNEIRRKKKAMTLSLRLENKPLSVEEEPEPATFWHRMNTPLNESDKEFQEILHRVDSIHEKHLKTWFKHNNEMKELEEKRKEIKFRYSSLHKKTSNGNNSKTSETPENQRVNKFFSLLQGRENSECHDEKLLKECFETFETEVSKRLTSSLPALNENLRRNSLKKEHEIKIKIDTESNQKTIKEPLKLRRSLKQNSTIEKKSKESEKHKIRKNSNKSDEILQITKNTSKSSIRQKSMLRSSTEVSLQKSEDKNNSVKKSSNFRDKSPIPNNKKYLSKEKEIRHTKLMPLKNLNKLKENKKLKIV